jgi:hypothetical protein
MANLGTDIYDHVPVQSLSGREIVVTFRKRYKIDAQEKACN